MKFRVKLFLILISFQIQSSCAQSPQEEIPTEIDWISFEEAQLKAQQTGKKILIFGHAEWCPYCTKMRKETFPDSTVLAAINKHFFAVELDVESEEYMPYNAEVLAKTLEDVGMKPEYIEKIVTNQQPLTEAELARYLKIVSFPTHFFIDSDGSVLGMQPGFIEADIYASLLNYVGSDAFKTMSFEEYFELNETN